MTGSSSPVAAVDIGTNTIRLLIAEVTSEGAVEWLDRRSVVTRLGRGVDDTGHLDPDAVDRTITVLTGFGEAIADRRGVAMRAIATSATRDATNRDVFLDRAETALGVRPEVVSGEEEASLAFAGATSDVQGRRPYLMVDVGGGSTELVIGDNVPSYVVSVDIGSVRLTERLLPHHPAHPEEVAAARRHVDELLTAQVTLPEAPGTVIGVAGTLTSLAAIHLDLAEYRAEVVQGTVLDLAALTDLVERLAGLTVEETAAIRSLDPARASVLLGGTIVAERVMHHVQADELVVTEHDVLDGIALSLVG